MRGFVRGLFGLVVLLLATPAWAMATLAGVVSLNRRNGPPVAGVAISALGANSVTSGNDGAFVLSFPQGRPGQEVKVVVNRAGWDVVNDILLDQRLPDNANAHPLEIIMCLSAEREQRVAEFYSLIGTEAVKRTYEAKLAELKGLYDATVQERNRLLRERDQALALVQEWARQAASHKPDDVGGIYRDALRLFVDGKAEAALQLLSDDRLQKEADKAKEQFDKANEQLNQVVQGWLLKGQLLISKFDYEGAGHAYEKAVTSAPGSVDARFAYAYFNQRQNRFAQARRDYEQAQALARVASDDATAALILNNLGALSLYENRHNDARKQFEEALDLFRALAKKNSCVYLFYVARTLNNLGALSNKENRYVDARKQFEEALGIYRVLMKTNLDVYRAHFGDILNNLGLLSTDEHRYVEAHKHYEEALGLYRALAKTNPDIYLPDVAKLLNNLGNLSEDEGNRANAHRYYEEALDLYRALAKMNPDSYQPYVATILHNLGSLSNHEHHTVDARKQYEEALGLFRTLAKTNRAAYLHDIAATLNNLGNLSRYENRYAEARKQFEEALDIRRALAKTSPDVYRPDVAITLYNLGLLSQDENRYAEARKQFEEALDILRQFAERAPATYQPRVQLVEDAIRALPTGP